MNKMLKLTRIGNSAGVILPKEEIDRMGLDIGSAISLSSNPRGWTLSVPEDDFDAQMAAAREVMQRRKRALRELAK
jgi:putative addiction module antidote